MYVIAIYLSLAVYLLIKHWKGYPSNTKADKIIYLCIALFFIFRFNLGRDFGGYCGSFIYWKDHPSELLTYASIRNPGFSLLMYVGVHLFSDYRWFMLLVNFINLGICSFVIFRHSKNILFSLMIFMASGLLEVYYSSGIRQMLAMSIFLLAFYEFLPKKRIVAYEALTLVACSFHETVLPALFIPLLYKMLPIFQKSEKKFLVILSSASIVMALILVVILPLTLPHLNLTFHYAPIINYLSNVNVSYMGIGMEVVFLVGILILRNWNIQNEREDFESFEELTFIISVYIYIALCGFSLMSRISDSMQVIMVILLPRLVNQLETYKRKQKLSFLGIVILNLFLLYSDYSANIPSIASDWQKDYTIINYPYICIFDGDTVDQMIERYNIYYETMNRLEAESYESN